MFSGSDMLLAVSEPEQWKQPWAVERDDPADALGCGSQYVQRMWVVCAVAAAGVHREGGLSVGGGGDQCGRSDHSHLLGQEAEDGVAAFEPGRDRRHFPSGVLGQYRDELIDVRGFEGGDV